MNKLTDSHLSKLSEYLQSHQKKTSLSLKITFNSSNEQRNLQIMKLIEEELSQLTHLIDLALHISKHSILTTKGYRILSNAISNLFKLNKLSIKIDYSCFLENEGLQTLQGMINHLPELIEINLEIFKSNFTTAECAQEFLDSLGINNTKLKTLNLNFKDIQNSSTNEGNIHFWRGISNLNNLEMLKIYLNTHSYGFLDIIELFELIANLEQLRSLHLIFYNEYGLDNRLLDELFPSIGKLTELRSFTLNYNFNVNLTEIQRKAILRNLMNLRFLEQLEIHELHKILFKNNCQEYLQLISNLKNLKMINWNFSSNQLCSEQITSIGQTLFQLENLVSFKLVLVPFKTYCRLQDDIQNWFSSMRNLHSFDLEIKDRISDIIIYNLAALFKRVEGLKSLKLKFLFPYNTNKIHFLENIPHLSNLKEIDLIFEYEYSEEEEQIPLLDSIVQLQQLERLYLKLSKCGNKQNLINNLEALCNTLRNLPKLKYLKFRCQAYLDMKQFNLLEKCFQSLQNLEFLSIDLDISFWANELEIKSLLNHLPNLKEIEICFIDHSFNIFGPSAANLLKLESCSLVFKKGIDIIELNQILESLSKSPIQKLHLDFFIIDNSEFQKEVGIEFSKFNSLEKLYVNTHTEIIAFMKIIDGIKQTKQLNSLSLETSSAFTQQDIQVLYETIKSLKILKKFNLQLNDTIDQDIEVFSLKSLISFVHLKHFQFDFFHETQDYNNFKGCFKIEQAFFLEQNQLSQQQQQLKQKSLKDHNVVNNQIQFEQPQQLFLENQMKSEDSQQVVTQKLNLIQMILEISPQNYKQLMEFDQKKFDYLNTEYLTTLFVNCNFYLQFPVELQLPYSFRDLNKQSKLKTLKFILEDCIMNEEIINYLSRNLKFLTNLQYLELSQKYSEDYYHLLFDSFQYLTNLLQISIKTNLSENEAISLGNSLKSMRKLESCELIIEEKSTFDSNGFYSIFNGLKQATRMKELTLTMNTIHIIENEDSQLVLSECISNMKLLQQLFFTIGTNQINQTSLREFFTSIGSLIFLKTLRLEIREENPLNQEMLDELIKAMSRLTNLHEFNILTYLETSKPIKISEDFATLFNNTPKTEFCNMVFETIENQLIFQQTEERLISFQSQSFQNLEVNLEHLNKIMKISYLIQVNTGILKNLKLGAPRKISQIVFYLKDEGDIDSMCEFISNIPNIFKINMRIDLSNFLKLNLENSLRNMSMRLPKLAKLKTLKVLNLELSSKDEGLEEMNCRQLMILLNALKKMEQLQELYLKTKDNSNLSNSMIPKIKKSILRLVQFNYLKYKYHYS